MDAKCHRHPHHCLRACFHLQDFAFANQMCSPMNLFFAESNWCNIFPSNPLTTSAMPSSVLPYFYLSWPLGGSASWISVVSTLFIFTCNVAPMNWWNWIIIRKNAKTFCNTTVANKDVANLPLQISNVHSCAFLLDLCADQLYEFELLQPCSSSLGICPQWSGEAGLLAELSCKGICRIAMPKMLPISHYKYRMFTAGRCMGTSRAEAHKSCHCCVCYRCCYCVIQLAAQIHMPKTSNATA